MRFDRLMNSPQAKKKHEPVAPAAKRELVENPAKEDVHEQRERGQEREGVVEAPRPPRRGEPASE